MEIIQEHNIVRGYTVYRQEVYTEKKYISNKTCKAASCLSGLPVVSHEKIK